MSYSYTMTVKCDGCGYRLRDAIISIRSDLEGMRWKWNKEMQKEGVMFREQWRKPTKIYCAMCADGPSSNRHTTPSHANDGQHPHPCLPETETK